MVFKITMEVHRIVFITFIYLQFSVWTNFCAGHDGVVHGVIGEIDFTCPQGTMFYGGYCYTKVDVKMSWMDASTTCKRNRMYSLTWIEDAVENNWIADTLMKGVGEYWIGLSSVNEGGQRILRWATYRKANDKLSSENDGLWGNLQPDNSKGDCVAVGNDGNRNGWMYMNCKRRLPFVCRMMAVPLEAKDTFFCHNGMGINNKWICDGQNDCGDNSDEVKCEQTSLCSYRIHGVSGTIRSNATSYRHRSTCRWTIEAAIGQRIKLMVTSDLEDNADVLSIWTGGYTLKESSSLGKITGTVNPAKTFYSANNFMILVLSSDGSILKSGFSATWTTAVNLISNEDQILNANNTWNELMSPYYPIVPFNLRSEWVIRASTKSVITIQFMAIDLPIDSVLEIRDGGDLESPLVYPSSLKTLPNPPIYISKSSNVRISLKTGSARDGNAKGFKLKYKEGCTLSVSGKHGLIHSPGWLVGGYPDDVVCEWTITRSVGETNALSMIFTDFNIKENSDFLKVYNDSSNAIRSPANGFTGSISPVGEIFRSTSGYLKVEFTSNLVLTDKGFRAEYSLDCPAFQVSEWTILSISGVYTEFKTMLNLTCQTGYSFKQEEYNKMDYVTIKCLSGGIWDVSRIPDCQITYCGSPPSISNGLIKESNGVTTGGNTTYRCEDGFTMSSNPTILCQSDGQWETPPTCNAQTCPQGRAPTNGDFNVTAGTGTDYASILKFFCNPGYEIIGPVYVYCQTSGSWSHTFPTCRGIKCPIPMDFQRGSITANNLPVVYNGRATVTCDPGFVINGTTNITCGEDGRFLPEVECIDRNECDLGSPCDTLENCINTIGSSKCVCKKGYSRQGQNCVDINECNENNGGCSDTCVNRNGGYSCTCPEGSELYVRADHNNITLSGNEQGLMEGDIYYINHTCIPKLCPSLSNPQNGTFLSNKELFYTNDTITLRCHHGYAISGDSTYTCNNQNQKIWSNSVGSCNIGKCKTPKMSTDELINRILPNEDVDIMFGEFATIECNYGYQKINKSIYCGITSTAPVIFGLLGDSLSCPVIDCGQPDDIPGSNYTDIGNTTFENSFTFSCNTGFTMSGVSENGSNTVTCRENGLWDFGNLTCTGSRCLDPGTPGGAIQRVTSYEVGQLLYFDCLRSGYEVVPPGPLLCEVSNDGNSVQWNASTTPLPLCTDKTAPVFSNCPNETIYIDKTQSPKYTPPIATDNSGGIKNVSVMPTNFQPDTIVSRDMDVTYMAEDFSGNKGYCTIKIRIKDRMPTILSCPPNVEEKITAASGKSINLRNFVNISDTKLIFSPSEIINVNSDSLELPQKVVVVAEDKYGTRSSCSFLIYTTASSCFRETFPKTLPNAEPISCTAGNITCTVRCKAGHVFPDGSTTKMYNCTGNSMWSPALPVAPCLPYESPTYQIIVEVKYDSGSQPASNCLSAHNQSLITNNNSLSTQVYNACNTPGLIQVGGIAVKETKSLARSFTFETTFTIVVSGESTTAIRDTCRSIIGIKNSTDINFLTYGRTLQCSSGTQTNITRINLTIKNYGNLCSTGKSIIQTSQYGAQCVSCGPGTYIDNGGCTTCADGLYQDLPGQYNCKQCLTGQVPVPDKTTCTAVCPPGFISSDGLTDCTPCSKDEYSLNTTYCEKCPSGKSTLNTTAIADVSGCKSQCIPGYFSTTGYEPCSACPLHHYQDQSNQKMCVECGTQEITDGPGKNSSSDCIDMTLTFCNSSQSHCNDEGNCEILNHMKYCKCHTNSNYTGKNCDVEIDPCLSHPCFNGGTCKRVDHSQFTCDCPVDSSCRMENAGQFTGQGQDRLIGLGSLAACLQECEKDMNCKSVHYHRAYCFIYSNDNPSLVTNSESVFYKKICRNDQLFVGDQCETDNVDSCNSTGNAACAPHGMCQDKLNDEYQCLCPKVGGYTGNRCELDLDLCDPDPCKNGGICKPFGSVRYQCHCKEGYYGKDCENDRNECQLNPNGCLYNSTCNNEENKYTCSCKFGFSGKHCQNTVDFCNTNGCDNGLCYNDYESFTRKCVCEPPYKVDSVSGNCVLMDPCMGIDCMNGTCSGGQCDCKNGYTGSRCQHNIDDCIVNPCGEHGKCEDRIGSFVCICDSGFQGDKCDQNIDDCPGQCNDATTEKKLDGVNECRCICKPGYTGINCTDEINECMSYPCQHNGTCIDGENDYTCNCTDGWQGKNCDKLYDYCSMSPCKNQAQCFNLYDRRFCRCKSGTRGDTCDVAPTLCNIIDPCVNSGTCWDTAGNTRCNCTEDFTGTSCQLIKDHCSPSSNPCKSTGTCKTKPVGYSCSCNAGYTGKDCGTAPNLCTAAGCHSSSKCIETRSRAMCYCERGQVLTDSGCKGNVDTDYDIVCDAMIGDEGAMVDGIVHTGGDFTVVLWVKAMSGTSTEETTVFSLRTGEPSVEVFHMGTKNLTIRSSESSMTTEESLEVDLGDGNWHHVAITWRNSSTLHVIVDAISADFSGTMSEPTRLSKVSSLKIGEHFSGRISQLSIWSSVLNTNEIYNIFGNRSYVSSVKPLQGWNNYMLSKGCRKDYPSRVKSTVCDDPFCSAEKTNLKVMSCNTDVSQYSASRIVQINNRNRATFSGNDIVTNYTLPRDGSYTQGSYSEIIVAKDGYGNYASCYFKVYVKYANDCVSPDTDGTPSYCTSSRSICQLTCPNNKAFGLPTPKRLACGKLGVYDVRHPLSKYRISNCGVKASLKIKLIQRMKYKLKTSCIDTFATAFNREIRDSLLGTRTSPNWGLCTSNCGNVKVNSTCEGNTNFAMIFLEISELQDNISVSGQYYKPKEIMRILTFQNNRFNFTTIAGAELQTSSVTFTESPSCANGYVIVGDQCVQCGIGSYLNDNTAVCQLCPVGYYQDSSASTSCNKCTGSKTTLTPGATRSSECVDNCTVGFRLDQGVCKPCPRHYYQDMYGTDFCLPCPVGKKTGQEGSNSSAQCYDDCPAGTELQNTGQCKDCAKGYYRSFNDDTCQTCNSTHTTSGPKQQSSADCNIIICYNGTYRNESENKCEKCPLGTYQDENQETSCKECPNRYSTRGEGAKNLTDCEFYCLAGEEVNTSLTETCYKCPRGMYRDGSNLYSNCVMCPFGNTTDNEGSTSVNDCKIETCSPGEQINSDRVCETCPFDTYQPMNIPTSTMKCIRCDDGSATKQNGSTNATNCLPVCSEGEQYNGQSCEPCPKGSFNDGGFIMKFMQCESCPENYTTLSTGSKNSSDCSLLDCPPGQIIVGDVCVECDHGEYQPLRHQTKCLSCEANRNTTSTGSTSKDDCQIYCPAGQDIKDGSSSCTDCLSNYVKTTAGLSKCTECTGNYTSNAQRTSCNELFCDKGFKSDNSLNTSMCIPCEKGTYKSLRGNNETCVKCIEGLTTTGAASRSRSDCNQANCIPGKYLDLQTNNCTNCPIGYYKESTGNENCTACPRNLTNSVVGSRSESDCKIVVCEKGEKRMNSTNTCEKCSIGKYQPNEGQNECMACQSNQTTENIGSTQKSECVPLCPFGKDFNTTSKMCMDCALGYYKSVTGNNQKCIKCPTGKTTTGKGSTLSSECNLDDCRKGNYRATGGCMACPKGTYQDENSQTSCKKCPSGKTTENENSTSMSACFKNCSNGQEYDRSSGSCVECAVGSYKNSSISEFCILCPPGRTNTDTGLSSCTSDITVTTTVGPATPRSYDLEVKCTFRIPIQCGNVNARLTARTNIRNVIIARLSIISARFSFCVVSDCFNLIVIKSFRCAGQAYTNRRKRAEEPVEVDVVIPDVKQTTTDQTNNVQQLTTRVIQEDMTTNADQYVDSSLGLVLQSVQAPVITATCQNGSTLQSGICQPCAIGQYHDIVTNQCRDCGLNTYQDTVGATRCKPCTGDVYKYTVQTASTSSSQCVSVCDTTPNYCLYGGTCRSDSVSVYCECTSRYTGARCSDFKEASSNTPFIIGGSVGGVVFIMLCVLIVVGFCVHIRKRKSSTKYLKQKMLRDDPYYDESMYNQPLPMRENKSFVPGNTARPRYYEGPRLNDAFNPDDYDNAAGITHEPFYQSVKKHAIDDENNDYSWHVA